MPTGSRWRVALSTPQPKNPQFGLCKRLCRLGKIYPVSCISNFKSCLNVRLLSHLSWTKDFKFISLHCPIQSPFQQRSVSYSIWAACVHPKLLFVIAALDEYGDSHCLQKKLADTHVTPFDWFKLAFSVTQMSSRCCVIKPSFFTTRSEGKRPDRDTVLSFEFCMPKAWDTKIIHIC